MTPPAERTAEEYLKDKEEWINNIHKGKAELVYSRKDVLKALSLKEQEVKDKQPNLFIDEGCTLHTQSEL